MKKWLLTIGTVGAIVSPIATVVACGDDDGDEKSDQDILDGIDTTNTQEAHDTISQYFMGDTFEESLQGWEMNAQNLSYYVTNTKKHGILPITDAAALSVASMGLMQYPSTTLDEVLDANIDTTVDGEKGGPQSKGNPIKQWTTTKQDIIDNDAINKIGDELWQYVNPNNIADKNAVANDYVIDVVETTDDADALGDGNFLTGEYEINIYKKKALNPYLTAAKVNFTDDTKWTTTDNMTTSMGGTYTESNLHFFQALKSGTDTADARSVSDYGFNLSYDNIEAYWNTKPLPALPGEFMSNAKEAYEDRSRSNGMATWVGFGPVTPIPSAEVAPGGAYEVNITSWMDFDRKEGIYYTILQIEDFRDGGTMNHETMTLMFENPTVNQYAKGTGSYDIAKLTNTLSTEFTFEFWFDVFTSLKPMLGNPIVKMNKIHLMENQIMETSNTMTTMAQVRDIIGDEDFFNEIKDFIDVEHPNFDWDTFTEALTWTNGTNSIFERAAFFDPTTWGGRSYAVLSFIETFYSYVGEFLDSTPIAQKWEDQMLFASTPEELYSQINHANLDASRQVFLGGNVGLYLTELEINVTSVTPKMDEVVAAALRVTGITSAQTLKITVNGIEGASPIASSDAAGIKQAITDALATDASLANCIEL